MLYVLVASFALLFGLVLYFMYFWYPKMQAAQYEKQMKIYEKMLESAKAQAKTEAQKKRQRNINLMEEYEKQIEEENEKNEQKPFAEREYDDINNLAQDYISGVLEGEEDFEE